MKPILLDQFSYYVICLVYCILLSSMIGNAHIFNISLHVSYIKSPRPLQLLICVLDLFPSSVAAIDLQLLCVSVVCYGTNKYYNISIYCHNLSSHDVGQNVNTLHWDHNVSFCNGSTNFFTGDKINDSNETYLWPP